MNNSAGVFLIVIVVIVVALFLWTYMYNCSVDSYSRNYVLQDNAYGKRILPSFTNGGFRPNFEGYSSLYDCRRLCANNSSQSSYWDCLVNCEMKSILKSNQRPHLQDCTTDGDCPNSEICIHPGFYTGNFAGYCISPHEPGIGEKVRQELESRENFTFENDLSRESCPPMSYFEPRLNDCTPIFQGSSSPNGIWSQTPAPEPHVFWPGTISTKYGVGESDPQDIATGYILKLDN